MTGVVLCATAVTRGWNGNRIRVGTAKLTLKEIGTAQLVERRIREREVEGSILERSYQNEMTQTCHVNSHWRENEDRR